MVPYCSMAMVFQLHIPSFPLNHFIENFVYYRDFQPGHELERFLPDGHINLVFDLTDQPKYIYDNETLTATQACRDVWFSGIRQKYITIPSRRDSEMLIVNFHRGKAYPFVKFPMNELTDLVVDAELVLPVQIRGIRHALQDIRAVDKKFRYLETQLLDLFQNTLHNNPLVDFAANLITRSPNATSIAVVSRKTGYSQKHLIRLFKQHIGLTPKSFLKVLRFQKAIQDIEKKKCIQWSDIAYDCGYYDQTHFIEDFKKFSGFTPGQYLRSKNENTNWVPLP